MMSVILAVALVPDAVLKVSRCFQSSSSDIDSEDKPPGKWASFKKRQRLTENKKGVSRPVILILTGKKTIKLGTTTRLQ